MDGTPSIELNRLHLGKFRHVCAFFHDDAEAYRALLPFIIDGFACGHRAVHVVQSIQETAHLRCLAGAGIDVAEASASGQLVIQHDTDTYLIDGRFDQDRMLAAFKAMASGDVAAEFPLSRIICNMGWVSDHPLQFGDVVEFEARVNEVWHQHGDIVICAYDLRKFGGDMVVDIMRTHPLVLIGDVLHENPFFIPPDQFVKERRQREGGGAQL